MAEPVRLALLGDPVAHSRSPAIQRVALRKAGIEGDYTAIRANVEILERSIEELRDGTLTGLNITMPLKEPAFRLADELTPLAQAAGSANTLRSRHRVVEAHTTDAVAFRELFEEGSRFPHGIPILILGSGGTARAALSAVEGREVYLSARSGEKAHGLCEAFDATGVVLWGSGLAGAVVVNATPIGMRGERLPARIMDTAAGLIDLPYGPNQTPAIQSASRSGTPFVDGVEFLARQARASFEWWTGEAVDLEPLVTAARNV